MGEESGMGIFFSYGLSGDVKRWFAIILLYNILEYLFVFKCFERRADMLAPLYL